MGETDSAVDSLLHLLEETSSDFAGLGQIDAAARRIRWRFAAGSISEARMLSITQKTTRGLSGVAIRTGRPAATEIDNHSKESLRLDEPLMFSEQLRSAAVVPVEGAAGLIGVILLGRRIERDYIPRELQLALLAATRLAGAIPEVQNNR
ncbi:GAF domain-containing protein [Paenibacillus sp. HB172176]|uniref:GAF domain-containing protein n=1 Tax=Paenibacillus sp. HB172176 TaxID=2493690 RepID=UPI00143CA756|nr:GAF domain-containing protein [Paenibacillus sp. HB172176]